MASPFDGMGQVLMGVLGATITHLPAAGGSAEISGHIRRYRIGVLDGEDRAVLAYEGTLRLPRDTASAAGVAVGDRVQDTTGQTYKIANKHDSASIGSDALIVYDLEEAD
jgi:hypothetical protein